MLPPPLPPQAPTPDSYFVELPTGERFGPADASLLESWSSEGRIPRDAVIVNALNGTPTGHSMVAWQHPITSKLVVAPPTVQGQLSAPPTMGGLIPYRNGFALAGYYTSIAALIPLFGLVLGPIAISLGALGLKKAAATPAIGGKAHAWVAISIGSIITLLHIVAIVLMIIYR